jgi:hypothetical protein
LFAKAADVFWAVVGESPPVPDQIKSSFAAIRKERDLWQCGPLSLATPGSAAQRKARLEKSGGWQVDGWSRAWKTALLSPAQPVFK